MAIGALCGVIVWAGRLACTRHGRRLGLRIAGLAKQHRHEVVSRRYRRTPRPNQECIADEMDHMLVERAQRGSVTDNGSRAFNLATTITAAEDDA